MTLESERPHYVKDKKSSSKWLQFRERSQNDYWYWQSYTGKYDNLVKGLICSPKALEL